MSNVDNVVDNRPHCETTDTPPQNHTTGTMEQIYQKVKTMRLSPAARVEVNKLLACAVRAGVAWDLPTSFLEGFTNLTEAIKAGKPVDYEKLEGMNAHCINQDVGGLHGVLERNLDCNINHPAGWKSVSMDGVYISALIHAWNGDNGWELWVEGDIPMRRKRRKTADQLKEYTYFRGKSGSGKTYLLYVGFPITSDRRNIRYAPSMLKSFTPADEWEVLEEYGTFPKLEGK